MGNRRTFGLLPHRVGFVRGIWALGLLLLTPYLLADEPLVRVTYRVLAEKSSPESSPVVIEKSVEGRVRVQAVDGGLLVEDRSSCMWPITASQKPRSETIAPEFTELTVEELAQSLQSEFGTAFQIVTTPHYVICTSAGSGYGEWCGQMFERLHFGFQKFWKQRIPGLEPPKRPLVAIVFANQKEYQAFQATDAGDQVGAALGYYSARTNRMVLYDASRDGGGGPALDKGEIQKRALRNPAMISTVIHEAVHQLSFNMELQTRYADNPVWFSEGLAMYFETPDVEARSGWRTIGQINPARLDRYRSLAKDSAPPIRSLIATDDRFRDPETAVDAYAEAWALHYFLIRARQDKYQNYLKMLAAKPPLRWETPDQRIADFEAAFGSVTDVERELRKFMARLRGGR